MRLLLLGQAKVFSCALSLSRNKREAELPRNMGWPREERGAGEEAPPGAARPFGPVPLAQICWKSFQILFQI